MTNNTPNNFKTSSEGLRLIKNQEGFRENAYQNIINGAADKITIGYGHTGLLNGKPLKLSDKITKTEAEKLLKIDLASREKVINEAVKVPINQNQFDSLMSLTYNIGVGGFKNSTLLKKLNTGDYEGASKEFSKWNKVNGKVNLGLTRRRATETGLFNKALVFKIGIEENYYPDGGQGRDEDSNSQQYYPTGSIPPNTPYVPPDRELYHPATDKVNYDPGQRVINQDGNSPGQGGNSGTQGSNAGKPPASSKPFNRNAAYKTPNAEAIGQTLSPVATTSIAAAGGAAIYFAAHNLIRFTSVSATIYASAGAASTAGSVGAAAFGAPAASTASGVATGGAAGISGSSSTALTGSVSTSQSIISSAWSATSNAVSSAWTAASSAIQSAAAAIGNAVVAAAHAIASAAMAAASAIAAAASAVASAAAAAIGWVIGALAFLPW